MLYSCDRHLGRGRVEAMPRSRQPENRHLRVTVIDRQVVFPAASLARIVMVVVPTYSAIGDVVQLSVPLAVPYPPVELVHVTEATPTLSYAVPLTTSELLDVARLLVDGDTIVKVGGVVSGPDGGGGGVVCWRVTVTPRVAWPCFESRPGMVMNVAPDLTGIPATVRLSDPFASPQA